MSDQIIQHALQAVRSHTTGELRFDEHIRPLSFITATDGRLFAPVMAAMIRSVDTVLFVPQCTDDALEIQITIEQCDEDDADCGAMADRWQIYHGEPEDVFWAALSIDAVRYEGHVIDGEAIMQPNTLADDQARLCRTLNTDHRDDMRLLCEHIARTDVAEPVVVGVDQYGVDVRRKFDVVRIPFDRPIDEADAAMNELLKMIEAARNNTGAPPS